MGNTTSIPPNLSDAEAVSARSRFKDRLATLLGVESSFVDDPIKEDCPNASREATANVILINIDDTTAAALSEQHRINVVPHVAIISHAFSWLVGTEMVLRVPPDEVTPALDWFRHAVAVYVSMQEDAKFRNGETAQLMVPNLKKVFEISEQGDHEVIFARDPLLAGIGSYNRDEAMDESGPKHDSDYVPRHFLAIQPLLPTEYASGVASVTARSFSALLQKHLSPIYLHRRCRSNVLQSLDFASALAAIRDSTPVKSMSDGVTVDLRIRKNGGAADIIFSGRCLAHLLLPLDSAFSKDPVPQGTVVGVIAEGGHSSIKFMCHDIDGTAITPDTSHFDLDHLTYGDQSSNIVDSLTLDEQLEMLFLPPSKLWETKRLIRMTNITVYLPREMMTLMLIDVRRSLDGRPSPVGMVWEWPELFQGNVKPGGLLRNRCDDIVTPCKFRLLCAPLEYFEDEILITDEGEYDPPLADCGYGENGDLNIS